MATIKQRLDSIHEGLKTIKQKYNESDNNPVVPDRDRAEVSVYPLDESVVKEEVEAWLKPTGEEHASDGSYRPDPTALTPTQTRDEDDMDVFLRLLRSTNTTQGSTLETDQPPGVHADVATNPTPSQLTPAPKTKRLAILDWLTKKPTRLGSHSNMVYSTLMQASEALTNKDIQNFIKNNYEQHRTKNYDQVYSGLNNLANRGVIEEFVTAVDTKREKRYQIKKMETAIEGGPQDIARKLTGVSNV